MDTLASFHLTQCANVHKITPVKRLVFMYTSPLMNVTVPADPRLRKRAFILMLTSFVAGTLFLSFFHGFLQDIEAQATASPQLAFEKLSLIRNTTLDFTLVCSTALVGLFMLGLRRS
jgi:hypothetical protein